MKKQFFLAAIIIVICLCFCAVNDSSLKACGTNVASCSSVQPSPVIDNSIREKIEHYIPSGYAEETDAPYEIFIHPFTQL